MTQQPFSRPGAIDLSALKRPAPTPPPAGGGAAGGGVPAGPSSYAVQVDEQNFQQVVESSMTALVLLVFYSPSRLAESVQLADDIAALSGEFEGKFLAGLVDIDAAPAVAQAVQLQSIPFVYAVIDGRPAPLLQDAVPMAELRAALTQVLQQLAGQGVTGRHQPLHAAAPAGQEGEDGEVGEPQSDPRYAAAEDALARDDVAGAVAEYQKLLDANPADAEAAAGLAMAKILLRTQGVDPAAVVAAADAAPDDVDAQTLAADVDLMSGDVDAAVDRLVELVRRTAGKERDRAREHLLGIFAAVGNDDERVLNGRRKLASALF